MLLKLDAVFEALLGAALVVSALSGALGGADFPSPVGGAALAAVGVVLILLAVAIWSGRLGLRALALGNAASAVAGLVWLAAVCGFSGAGTALVAFVVGALTSLAAAQLATLQT